MIAVDTNILVYAHRRESRFHASASSLLGGLCEGRDKWAIPWPCIYEFFSVVTNNRIWKDDVSTSEQAWNQIEAWTDSPTISLLKETENFLEILQEFAQRPRVRGAIIHDARIAALCIAHGVEKLFTLDRDYHLFTELPTYNPLT